MDMMICSRVAYAGRAYGRAIATKQLTPATISTTRTVLACGCRRQRNSQLMGRPSASILPRFHTFSTTSSGFANTDAETDEHYAILQASLDHVHQYGWTRDAVAQAVLSSQTGSSPSVAGSIGLGPEALVSFFMKDCNERLRNHLLTFKPPTQQTSKDRTVYAIRYRLELVVPYVRSRRWHEGMAIGALRNTRATASELDDLVSTVLWYRDSGTMGSQSPVRKAFLGSVYAATELHLLADDSPGYDDTWAFLERRVDEWESLSEGNANAFLSSASFLPSRETVVGATAVAASLGSALFSLAIPTGVRESILRQSGGIEELVKRGYDVASEKLAGRGLSTRPPVPYDADPVPSQPKPTTTE